MGLFDDLLEQAAGGFTEWAGQAFGGDQPGVAPGSMVARQRATQQLTDLLKQLQTQGRATEWSQLSAYIDSDWKTPITSPALRGQVEILLGTHGFTYDPGGSTTTPRTPTTAGGTTSYRADPTVSHSYAASGDLPGRREPGTGYVDDPATGHGTSSSAPQGRGGGSHTDMPGYRERGPGYGPSPSGMHQQSGPGGLNTLGTVGNGPYGDRSMATEPIASVTTNTSTGTRSGKFGQFQSDDLDFLFEAMANSPEYAAQILRLAQGQTSRPLGRFADARDSMYGRAMQAALGLGGIEGFGSLEQIASDFLNQGVLGNNTSGYVGGLGQRARGLDYTDIDSLTMEKMLKSGLALEGMQMGGLGQQVNRGYLDDIIWQDEARNFGTRGDATNFADLLQNSRYQRAMRTFADLLNQ